VRAPRATRGPVLPDLRAAGRRSCRAVPAADGTVAGGLRLASVRVAATGDTRVRSAASCTPSNSAALRAPGFSIRMCLPCKAAACAIGASKLCVVQMKTASTSSRATTDCQCMLATAPGCISASFCALSKLRSQQAVMAARPATLRTLFCPIRPQPITAIRRLRSNPNSAPDLRGRFVGGCRCRSPRDLSFVPAARSMGPKPR